MMSWIGAIQKNNNPDKDVSCALYTSCLKYSEVVKEHMTGVHHSLTGRLLTTMTSDTLNYNTRSTWTEGALKASWFNTSSD